MGVGKFDPDLAIREGWARDQEDEVSFDGYNAFLQITTSDGTSGFSVTNAVGGAAFSAKSDGDGYVARNLGVGTYNPTTKLEVIGVTKTEGLQVTTGASNGYVLTSDNDGVATWQPSGGGNFVTEDTFQEHKAGQEEINKDILKSLDGYLDSDDHRDLDQLVHNIAETSYEQFTYSGNRVTNAIIWTDSGMTTKIREEQFTYSGNKVATAITIQYDGAGSAVETLTETYSYSGNKVINIDRVLT